ncbi:MAG: LysE family translocator [Melioribacteraceae bacterium]|nr:LysE family translocator [Melioribacteraceae bacterium]MCF8356831.1 LysE family translocator [Melioribacteraceae bacterium]MCF8394027.1 LysE family translocator [Melioribacteraceae bacterium]MCF8419770.1 LysE family translocator [Melioribacteraceae bacterium]
MEITFFLQGALIGFLTAVPIGPIGIICIRKTLTEGWIRGLIVGLGAATADLLYGFIAAFGVTFISDTVDDQRVWIRLIGGVILLILGFRTFRTKPADPKIQISGGKLKSYISIFFLTLTNPLTIFAFIAVFTALGLAKGLTLFSSALLVAGVFTGSGLWFLLLSSTVVLFRKKLDFVGLRWVNRVAGIFIFCAGIIAMGSLI